MESDDDGEDGIEAKESKQKKASNPHLSQVDTTKIT
jgi:hypothetical protein